MVAIGGRAFSIFSKMSAAPFRAVRPAGFYAVMTQTKGEGIYNVVVIGAGTGGLVTAAGTAGLGGRVALIERDKMGGDCLNFGCVPSKALISSARLVQRIRDAEQWGLENRNHGLLNECLSECAGCARRSLPTIRKNGSNLLASMYFAARQNFYRLTVSRWEIAFCRRRILSLRLVPVRPFRKSPESKRRNFSRTRRSLTSCE